MRNLAPFFAFLLTFACTSENANKPNHPSPTTKNHHTTKKTIQQFQCAYDSMLVEKYETYDANPGTGFRKTGIVLQLDANSIGILKTYLTDSIIHRYSCCPDFRNKLRVFSEGKICCEYYVSTKGRVSEEKDETKAFLVPEGYQYRIKIPIEDWEQILKRSKPLKLE